ncbi:polysaccharide biosynthesis tyrosine autokinase [Blastococcus atacamensis]|uniref:polysaccharide biosynthesis tyrosine autokinase n=1 Tax=Blastococcus atacamensis TaxID=2070508 RepID=UPI0018E4677E|nr:polysaccharide biosynthesis tyrosine autokinase [Blastococcus atacamensis]
MELRVAVGRLRTYWWLPLLGALLGLVVGATVSATATPLYSAQTQLFVLTTDATTTTAAFQGSQFSQQRVTSYARLLRGEEVANRVIDDLGLDMTPQELAAEITAVAPADTVLIDVSVTDPSPELAQRIADSVGVQFKEFVEELETPSGAAVAPVKVTVTDAAELPEAPSSPNTVRNLALGVVLGLVLGAFAVLLRGYLDRSIKDPEQAGRLGRVPVIGAVIRDDHLAERHFFNREGQSRAAEDYRQLRANLQFLNVDNPPRVIMVSSAMPSEGKTTAVINLGLALAEAGRKVALVDADLRRPRVTRYLGLVGGVGLTNVLAGTAGVADVIQPFADTGLSVIGAGPAPPNPSELLASKHMLSLLEELRVSHDYVLIDAPPLLPVADATGIAVIVDGVVLSVRYGQTRTDQLEQAAATLERVGARSLGLILNIVPPKAGVGAAYGYGSDYGESAPGAESAPRTGRRRA